MINWTRQRLEGKSETPPVVYASVERRSGKPMNNLGMAHGLRNEMHIPGEVALDHPVLILLFLL